MRRRAAVGAALVVAVILGGVGIASGEDKVTAGDVKVDPPTPRCLGFRWYVEGDDNGNARAEMEYREYRKKGAEEWKRALPLLRVHGEVVDKDHGAFKCGNLFAGSILFLQPGTESDVRLELADPDGGVAASTAACWTGTRGPCRRPPSPSGRSTSTSREPAASGWLHPSRASPRPRRSSGPAISCSSIRAFTRGT